MELNNKETLNGRITFLIGQNETTIQIKDENSRVKFCEINMTPQQLSSALSRLAETECQISVGDLDKVGKTMEVSTIKLSVPQSLGTSRWELGKEELKELKKEIQNHLDAQKEGWVLTDNFESKGSFAEENGDLYVNATIRRWV